METERDPFDSVDDDGVADVHRQDVALRGSVVEVPVYGEVMEVAVRAGQRRVNTA
jgi:hypothetical protein